MATRVVVQYDLNALTQVGEDLILPTTFTVEAQQEDEETPDVVARFVLDDGAPRCREVRVVSRDGGREVRSEDCRKIRVGDLLDEGIKAAALGVLRTDSAGRPQPPEDVTSQQRVSQVRTMRRRTRRPPDDELLRETAEVYRQHINEHPTQAVADHFAKAPRTAALYVQAARKRGFLGAAIKGKAGEQS